MSNLHCDDRFKRKSPERFSSSSNGLNNLVELDKKTLGVRNKRDPNKKSYVCGLFPQKKKKKGYYAKEAKDLLQYGANYPERFEDVSYKSLTDNWSRLVSMRNENLVTSNSFDMNTITVIAFSVLFVYLT
ncbi:hypothetical protein RFI_11638 [Reticulomyxa filosa]|uniref:Uncharacterized protein n=1 Tax=Reticulomyxa filosa TaxID=46433 RepID=X6NHW8_RETFI|nr:hypothetical protein RFI_11638 [Reticulomyxa filosa]|eukprot:ETO25498.1 hypothetical protein RFI_11638 [Reticulomyxa filosa]